MKPKCKGGTKAGGVKRKKGKITPQTTIDDMFSMINDDVDDDSVSEWMGSYIGGSLAGGSSHRSDKESIPNNILFV